LGVGVGGMGSGVAAPAQDVKKRKVSKIIFLITLPKNQNGYFLDRPGQRVFLRLSPAFA